ncbi:MAG TPA: anthranilate synthase component I family protein [Gracilimonas sp.]|uniref:anthranilate synthase component I family protein n=1 Tax=Gracilimonas sp. TaxID=1974203 RepID=UPI002DAB97C5|nr:anthranilate synthase component I family protein [Gracilimonas sp.]
MQKDQNYISQLITQLRKQGAVVLLESQMEDHPASTKSYLAAQPKAWIKAFGDEIEVMDNGNSKTFKGDPWDAIRNFREEQNDWLFGYFGYDLKNYTEQLTSNNPAVIDAPDLFFMVPSLLIEIDHQYNINVIGGELPNEIESHYKANDLNIKLTGQVDQNSYLKRVKEAQKNIYEGDFYEINLSHPLEFSFEGDSLTLYQAMKAAGPVPFGGYVAFDDIAICCSSPERFLARQGNKVCSQPIKGTVSRRLDKNDEADIARLKNSQKERAENLMIVDLVRNDLNKVAIKNSVKVSNLFEIQSFETVHQMVSTVECLVKEETDSIDLIKVCFPMGSMTGAPKIAAMQAIDDYEGYKRGVYSGALGYIKPDGDFDLNVIIRTGIMEGNKLIYPVGGAITSDSDPKAEWEETLLKARAITDIFSM